MIRDGADFEDEGLRPMNHFFDPRTGGALHFDPATYPQDDATRAAIAVLNATAVPSPDYALGISSGSPTNAYTYQSAHDYFMQALTGYSSVARKASFGLLFESMGHIVHHIQDMAQPQHVRNDPHVANDGLDANCNPPANFVYQALCPAYQHLHNPSSYESWTARFTKDQLPLDGYSAVYSPISDGLNIFTDPTRFWTYSGKGMADFTNRNFLSAGTMNLSPPLVGQAYEMSVQDLCNGAIPSCGDIALDQTILFYPSTVDDHFRSSQGPNPFAASASIFTPDLQTLNPLFQTVYTANRATFAYDHLYLLPRAVGYSAGLINYFFRGDMQITPPDEGVYAIVDQSSAGCGSPCGFRNLKLKLKNITPGDGPSGEEPMAGGKLWAVVKFHLNTCYEPDLSGEYGGSNFTGDNCRLAEEFITVSNAVPMSGISAIDPESLIFDFEANPIPIFASDVFLQVVFQGKLGQEDGAVAVATKDISEPNFFGVSNMSDYAYDTVDAAYHKVPYLDTTTTKDMTNIRLQFDNGAGLPVATMALLAGGQHAQVAYLADTGQTGLNIRYDYAGDANVLYQRQEPVYEFTADDDVGPYTRTCQVTKLRGLYRDDLFFVWQLVHGLGSWEILKTVPTVPSQQMATNGSKPGSDMMLKAASGGTSCITSAKLIGIKDFSAMTVQTVDTALSWNINF